MTTNSSLKLFRTVKYIGQKEILTAQVVPQAHRKIELQSKEQIETK